MARIETVFTADDRDIQRKLLQLNTRMDKFAEKTARSSSSASKSLQGIGSSIDSIGPALSRMGGLFAAAFSAREVIALADTFTRFETKLINAKVAAGDMAKVQGQLISLAKANGQEIVSLADLYGNMAMSAKSLGMTQSQIMTATESVAAAMRVSGATTAQASATILQLGQALAGGTVRAEEYNSMLENSPALVRAIAESSTKYAGDLGKLRKAINDGKVSSQEWGQALIDINSRLKTDAANAPLTVAANFQNLQTALIEYIGKADDSLGASEKLGFAIKMLGDNIGTVFEFIAAGATIMAGRYAAGIAVATVSNIRYQATLVTMAAAQANVTRISLLATTAMRGLSGAMALAGGPWGIAFMAIAAAIFFIAKRANEGSKAQQELAAQTDLTKTALEKYEEAAVNAANASGAAKKTALENADAMRVEAEQAVATSRALLMKARAARVAAAQTAQSTARALVAQGATAGSHTSEPQRAAAIVADRQLRQAQEEEFQAGYDFAKSDNELRQIQTTARTGGYRNADTSTATPSRGGGGGSSGPTPPTAAEVAANDADLQRETSRRLIDATAALADTVEARHANALQHLQWEAEDARRAVDKQQADKEITDTAATAARLAIDNTLIQRQALAEKERQKELAEEATRRAQEQADIDQSIARIQQDTLMNRADLADTLGERLVLERQAFDLYQSSERAAFDARQEEVRARLRLANQLDAEAENRLKSEADAFTALQQSQADGQRQKERDTNPFARFVDSAKDINTQFKEIAADGLESFTDGIVDAALEAQNLGQVFKGVAKGIIADLMKIYVRKMLVGALGNVLGIPSGPAAAIPGGGDGGGLLPGRLLRAASGTNFSQGGMTLVGEHGMELVNMPRGGQVMPTQDLRDLKTPSFSGASAAPVFNMTTVVNAEGALMLDNLRAEVAQGHMIAIQRAKQETIQDLARRDRGRLR